MVEWIVTWMVRSDSVRPLNPMKPLDELTTESHHPDAAQLDRLDTRDILQLIHREDAGVAAAVAGELEPIARGVDMITQRLGQGGRLVYLGAGTSGRLGILDAAECPPTFNSDPTQVVGIIAGGPTALTTAVEGAEDRPELAAEDLQRIGLSEKDVLVGIATSGRTPYVLGGMRYARGQQAYTIGLCCNRDSEIGAYADLMITPIVGPEVISGSTRMKAGTATKMVLNMLTTTTMVRLGKTYGNLMVDLRATNSKLQARAQRILKQLTNLNDADAGELLARCHGELKSAIVVYQRGLTPDGARARLRACGGHLRKALE